MFKLLQKFLIVMSVFVVTTAGAEEMAKKSTEPKKVEAQPPLKAQEKTEQKKDLKKEEGKRVKEEKPVKRMFAKFTLTHGGKPFGEFKAKLYFKRVPLTVENFIGLTEGTVPFREALPGKKAKVGKITERRFYDGVAFHRVIRGFMIQGGDPTGTGRYTPGYNFDDEFHPNLKHDKKGLLSMANPGKKNSNGSQFFITVAPRLPHLDNKHTIFGEVVEGYDIVEKASKVKTDMRDKPEKPLVMEKVEIIRVH